MFINVSVATVNGRTLVQKNSCGLSDGCELVDRTIVIRDNILNSELTVRVGKGLFFFLFICVYFFFLLFVAGYTYKRKVLFLVFQTQFFYNNNQRLICVNGFRNT